MDNNEYRTFTNEEEGLSVRAVWLEQIDMDLGDGPEILDAFIWFASIRDHDSWYAFSASDTLENPEELLESVNMDELRKMSVWFGWNWEKLHNECAHCAARIQREARKELDPKGYHDIMETPIEDLDRLRAWGSFNYWRAFIYDITRGQVTLSAN